MTTKSPNSGFILVHQEGKIQAGNLYSIIVLSTVHGVKNKLGLYPC